MHDGMRMREEFAIALEKALSLKDEAGMIGHGLVVVRDRLDRIKDIEPFANQITTSGDTFYATRGAAGIGTPNISQPTLVSGMKLGTGGTAVAKSGAGAALITYLTASNRTFDTTHPQLEDLASDTGFNIIWQVTWPAGVATNSAITEAVIVNDAATNATSSAANTIARILFAAKDKGADDSLAITWKHTFNG